MTSGRPLLFVVVLLIVLSVIATSALAADDKAQSQPATADLFGQNGVAEPASDLFFLNGRPRLYFTAPDERSRSAVLNPQDCYTMRMYKVKRKERFANGENGLRGYSTCELASKYQMRTAVAHVQTAERHDSQVVEQKK